MVEAKHNLKEATDDELVHWIVMERKKNYFRELYVRYANAIFNKCLQFEHDEDKAKDLAQDILIKIYLALSKFQSRSKFSSWIYSIAYNHCVDHVRSRKKSIVFEMAEKIDAESLYVSKEEPTDEVILQLKSENLRVALNLILPDEKSLLLLKYQDNVSITDLAELNDCTEGAIKMRLSRAKIKVKEIYDNI